MGFHKGDRNESWSLMRVVAMRASTMLPVHLFLAYYWTCNVFFFYFLDCIFHESRGGRSYGSARIWPKTLSTFSKFCYRQTSYSEGKQSFISFYFSVKFRSFINIKGLISSCIFCGCLRLVLTKKQLSFTGRLGSVQLDVSAHHFDTVSCLVSKSLKVWKFQGEEELEPRTIELVRGLGTSYINRSRGAHRERERNVPIPEIILK